MLNFISLTLKSLLHRKLISSFAIMLLSISFCLAILNINFEKSFARNISSIDLIVSSKQSDIDILLQSISYENKGEELVAFADFEKIEEIDEIKFLIPLTFGDYYKSFAVVATNEEFYDSLTFNKQALKIKEGVFKINNLNAVLGFNVALQFTHNLNDEIKLKHGNIYAKDEHEHKFIVKGVLEKTNTAVDNIVLISLNDFSELHSDNHNLTTDLNSILIALKNKQSSFKVKNMIENNFNNLRTIIPALTISKLFKNFNNIQQTLDLFVNLLLFLSFFASLAILLSNLDARKREMQVYKTLTVDYCFLFKLNFLEIFIIVLCALFVSLFLLMIIFIFCKDFLLINFNILLSFQLLNLKYIYLLLKIGIASLLISLLTTFYIQQKI